MDIYTIYADLYRKIPMLTTPKLMKSLWTKWLNLVEWKAIELLE